MKKILITLILLLTTLLTFGQSAPYFMRAKSFQMGLKNSESKIVWDASTLQECDILIKLDEKQATVFSKITQRYEVISFDGKYENGASRWYCSNSEGKNCNIYLMPPKDGSRYLSLVVEFSDWVWYYKCIPTN